MQEIDAYDVMADKHGVAVKGNVKTIAIYSAGFMMLGLLCSFLLAGKNLPGIGTLTVAALSCIAVGAGLGFLFGIPKSAQSPEPTAKGTTDEGSFPMASPRDNTNLEQISDWLVKIIIGASLVQLDRVKALLLHAAGALNKSLSIIHEVAGNNTDNGGLAATVTQSSDSVGFCVFFLIYFLSVGFLCGYLMTRIWLPYVMLMSSLAMDSAIRAAVSRAKQQGARAALHFFGLSDSSDLPASKTGSAKMSPSNLADEINDDPNKGKFGGKAEANGFKLSAAVVKMVDIDEDYFRVSLKVTTDGTRKLEQPVTFHLHPTFNPSTVNVSPISGQVILERAAWGAFTVGVEINEANSEPVKLELDLAELAGVPELFKSR